MARTRLLFVACFVVAFAAGATAGLVVAKCRRGPHDRSWSMAELNLTSGQRDQMGKIWRDVMEGASKQPDQRRAITEERDKAIVALLTPQQQAEYEQIVQECNRKLGELSQERNRAFEQAVERTKQVLTPDQAKQYEELMKKQRERGFGGPPGMRSLQRPEGPRSRRAGPRSRPSSDERQAPHGGE